MVDKQTVLRSLGLVTLGKVLGQIVSWSVTIIVMRWLTPADYGLSATVFALLALLTAFSEYVLINQIVRHPTRSIRSMQRAYEGFAVVFACLSVLVLLLAGLYYAALPGKESVQTGMLLMCLHVALLPLRIGPEAHILRSLQYGVQVRVTLVASIVGAIATGLAAASGAGFLSLLLGPLVREAALCFGYRLRAQSTFRPRFGLTRLRMVLLRSKHLMLGEFMVHAGAAFPILLYSQTFNVTQIGYFTTASYWALMPLSKVMNIVNQVALPVLSKMRRDEGGLNGNKILLPARFMVLVTAMAYGMFALLAETFVSMIVGDQWLPMAALLVIFCISMPIRALRAFITSPLQADAHDSVLLRMQLIQVSASWVGAGIASQLPFAALTPVHVAMSALGTCGALCIGWRALGAPLKSLFVILGAVMLVSATALAIALTAGSMYSAPSHWEAAALQAAIYAFVFILGVSTIDRTVRNGLKNALFRKQSVSS